jgi:hypothetical protein
MLALLALALSLYSNFTQWENVRAWAALDSAASGRRYPLHQDVAIVGRRTPSTASIFQVEVRDQAISRMHLMIFRDFYAIDVRSRYGTTVNGKFLQYGEQARLEDRDVIALAGVAAFVFHPLTYRAWQYFWHTPLSDDAPPTGWGLLIDGKRRLVFPLTRDEVFIAPTGDNGIEPHDHPEGAIAIIRRLDTVGRVDISSSRTTVELRKRLPEDPHATEIDPFAFARPAEDPHAAEVDLFAFPRPGATGQSVEFDNTWLTIEDVADGQALEADIKLDDYTYGRFVVPEAQQYFHLRSSRGDRDHSLSELAFHQGERRFQVIWRDPDVESPSRDSPR